MALRRKARLAILERDNHTCRYCGQTPNPQRYFNEGVRRWVALIHVDHVVPRSKGGTDDPENLVTACADCNLTKYDRVWTPA